MQGMVTPVEVGGDAAITYPPGSQAGYKQGDLPHQAVQRTQP